MRLRASIEGRGEEAVSQLRRGWTTNMAVCRSATVTKCSWNGLRALYMLKKTEVGSFPPMIRCSLCRLALLAAVALSLGAQEDTNPGTEDKRILWIFTNHR